MSADAAARFLAALPSLTAAGERAAASASARSAAPVAPHPVAPEPLPLALSVAEVAALLRVDRKTVYGAIAVGDLPARRVGAGRKRFVIGRDALLAWLAGAA